VRRLIRSSCFLDKGALRRGEGCERLCYTLEWLHRRIHCRMSPMHYPSARRQLIPVVAGTIAVVVTDA
jgi:hypothetical protein